MAKSLFTYRLLAMAFINNGLRQAGYEFDKEGDKPDACKHLELIAVDGEPVGGEQVAKTEPAAAKTENKPDDVVREYTASHRSGGVYVVKNAAGEVMAEYAKAGEGEAPAKDRAEAEAARLNGLSAVDSSGGDDSGSGLPDA